MKKLLVILLISLFTVPTFAQEQIDSAKKYLYVREIGRNRHPDIDRWNRFTKAPLGSNWCASFVSSMIRTRTTLKSALARNLLTKNSISYKEVLAGKPVPKGSVVVWKRGNTIFGHAALVIEWNGASGKTIEGNTSSGNSGSQSDGDGVYIRTRKIQPYNSFRIIGFTPIP